MNSQTTCPSDRVFARGASNGIHIEISYQLSLSLLTQNAPLRKRLMAYVDKPVLPKDVRQFVFDPRILDWRCVHRSFPVYGETFCWHRHLFLHIYSLSDPSGDAYGDGRAARAWWHELGQYREASSRKEAASLAALAAVGCVGPAGEAHRAVLGRFSRWLIGKEMDTWSRDLNF
jgi:hypothetical protein